MNLTQAPKHCSFRFSFSHAAAVAAIAVLAFIAAWNVPQVFAQHTDKMVQGKVEDQNGVALTKAIVYLKNSQSLDVKSYITEADGVYRFGQISSNVDYKLWAELQGKKSQVKTISSFDDKRKLLINLHIDGAK